MTEVRFYHLVTTGLDAALPVLLEKTLAMGKRAVVMATTPERVEQLVTHLWRYRDESWLPHGSAADGEAVHQPIWLTDADENPNNAQFLFLTDRAQSARMGSYERVLVLFDDRDRDAVADARTLWKSCRDAGHAMSYWQQTPRGIWEKKAEHGPE